MYTLDDLNNDLGAQIRAIQNAEGDQATRANIEKGRSAAEIGKVIVDGYKTKISALKIMENQATPAQMKNMIKSSGFSDDLNELGDFKAPKNKLEAL